jgi:hypothetical protein
MAGGEAAREEMGLLTGGELSAREHFLLDRLQDEGQRRRAEGLVLTLHIVHKGVTRGKLRWSAIGFHFSGPGMTASPLHTLPKRLSAPNPDRLLGL